MINQLKFVLSVFFACFLFEIQAEDDCGNTALLKHADAAYVQDVADADLQILLRTALSRSDPDSVLSIPVVFHVLHLGEALNSGSNVSDARILAALNTANVQWNDKNDRGAYMAIEFCLAQTDPYGKPTTGIDRINASSVPNYSSQGIGYAGDPGADETTLKSLSNWPHDKYYNIWIVNKIAGGWAGFAYYPTANNFSNDGTIIAANSVQGGNETLAHELGHGVGLYHTFEGSDDAACPPDADCSTQGDKVCDTPPHKKADCILSPCSSSPELYLSTYNIMSYCNAIRNLFTEGQKMRCRNAVFTTTRLALLNSTVCESVPTAVKIHSASELKIYPNPTSGTFTLEMPATGTEKLRVCNMLGQVVDEIELKAGTQHAILLSDKLISGIYSMQVLKEGELLDAVKIVIR